MGRVPWTLAWGSRTPPAVLLKMPSCSRGSGSRRGQRGPLHEFQYDDGRRRRRCQTTLVPNLCLWHSLTRLPGCASAKIRAYSHTRARAESHLYRM
eukprot:5050941-Alexandrium_andersonii.AAC.1